MNVRSCGKLHERIFCRIKCVFMLIKATNLYFQKNPIHSQKRLTTFVSLRFIRSYTGYDPMRCILCKSAKLVKRSRPTYHLRIVWDFQIQFLVFLTKFQYPYKQNRFRLFLFLSVFYEEIQEQYRNRKFGIHRK